MTEAKHTPEPGQVWHRRNLDELWLVCCKTWPEKQAPGVWVCAQLRLIDGKLAGFGTDRDTTPFARLIGEDIFPANDFDFVCDLADLLNGSEARLIQAARAVLNFPTVWINDPTGRTRSACWKETLSDLRAAVAALGQVSDHQPTPDRST